MNHFEDFRPSGQSFLDRIGEPSEIDAAVGRIALGFALLEDSVGEIIKVLIAGDQTVSSILTAEMSFRQRVDVLGSLGRHRLKGDGPVQNVERLDEVLQLCRRAEALRNTYLHSSYFGGRRTKTTAKASEGLRLRVESVDSSLLLDVADFISESALICRELPVHIGIADELVDDGEAITYTKAGRAIGQLRQ